MPDGSVKELRLTGQWSGLKATVDGVETPLEAPIPKFLLVLSFLPIALVAVGGLIGGAFGGAGAAINTGIARMAMPTAAKVLANARRDGRRGRVLVARPRHRDPGHCCSRPDTRRRDVHQRHRGGQDDHIGRIPVSCTSPHDNEVVGSSTYNRLGCLSRSARPGNVCCDTVHHGVQHLCRRRFPDLESRHVPHPC